MVNQRTEKRQAKKNNIILSWRTETLLNGVVGIFRDIVLLATFKALPHEFIGFNSLVLHR